MFALYGELAIKPSDAKKWVHRYLKTEGWKEVHTEKHPHRPTPDNFEDVRTLALEMLRQGFKMMAEEAKEIRPLRNAKDWAFARLNRTDL